MQKFLLLAVATTLFTTTAWADANKEGQTLAKPDNAKKTEVKVNEVRFCPMMGHPVGGKGAGKRVYKEHTLYFCCGGCAPAFDALSPEEKENKFLAALSKQQEADKKKQAAEKKNQEAAPAPAPQH